MRGDHGPLPDELLERDLISEDSSEDEEQLAGDGAWPEMWLSHFSVAGGVQWGHLIRVFDPQGFHWFESHLDGRVSDPLGRFQVYVTDGGLDAAVTVEWSETGPVLVHRAFKPWMFGSPTLAPPHIARTSWRSPGSIWATDERPTSWEPELAPGW